jgi:hypothetical protein
MLAQRLSEEAGSVDRDRAGSNSNLRFDIPSRFETRHEPDVYIQRERERESLTSGIFELMDI